MTTSDTERSGTDPMLVRPAARLLAVLNSGVVVATVAVALTPPDAGIAYEKVNATELLGGKLTLGNVAVFPPDWIVAPVTAVKVAL